MSSFEDLATLIEDNQEFCVLTHRAPDGDAIGSSLAFHLYLLEIGKQSIVGSIDKYPDYTAFLPNIGDFKYGSELSNQLTRTEYDVFIALDVAQPAQLGELYEMYSELTYPTRLVNVDHHKSNTFFGDLNLVKITTSTTQLLYEYFMYNNISITKNMATCIMAGLITDSKGFSLSNVTGETFGVARDLMTVGIDLPYIFDQMRNPKSIDRALLEASLISKIVVELHGRLVWLMVTYKEVTAFNTSGLASDLASYLIELRDVEISAVFVETENRSTKSSYRGKMHINFLPILQEYGGGGHPQAAGCYFAGISAKEATSMILPKLRTYLETEA